ncbi:MAG: T9SS type A sorting domain-containing protein [Melioribacter sp.]|nr:T9SS type A sorting domain-containing protein [Melioribacter sp.]
MKKLFLTVFILFIWVSNLYPQTGNTFTAAFDSLHKKLSVYYAFTDWKKINWQNLYTEFKPRIAAAEAQNDSSAFILAMKEYTYRIPDGHVGFSTGFYYGVVSSMVKEKKTPWVRLEKKLREQYIGGSYGFTLIKLDDGRFVVRLVNSGSPADLAGIKFGAEILEVNDKNINNAIDSVSVLWGEKIPATKEGKLINQCRLIGRAPIGSSIKIKFKNRGDQNPSTKTLSAVNDNYKTFDLTSMIVLKEPVVSSRILDGGYGYLEITACIPPVSVLTDFMSAFISLSSNPTVKQNGMILDLRINSGGQDCFAAAVAGCFYSDTTIYEYQSSYDPVTNSFQRVKLPLDHLSFQTLNFVKPTKYPLGSLYIEPQGVSFTAPVVVMVSPRNESSGEGIAMALQKLPQCKVVSFYGTHGSFGITAEPFKLLSTEDSLTVSYPDGRSLDAYNRIQLDSDSDMKGGVIPNIRPPLNEETIDKIYLQGIDYELEFALQELKKMNGIVGVQNQNNQIPESYSLYQNYPNPFNPTTIINYSVPKTSFVIIKVYDVLGREVAVLVNDIKLIGNYSVQFNASKLVSGIYFYRMQAGNFFDTKKLILMK